MLLRVASGALLTTQGAAYLLQWPALQLTTALVALIALSAGVLLLLGCLTRVAALVAVIVCVSGVFSWVLFPNFNIFEPKLAGFLVATIAAAVVCLGPGAFSLDALLFGRREIVIPK